jgi:hypothetical protein
MSPALFTPEKQCYSVLNLQIFQKGLPRPTAKAPRREGRGARRFSPRALALPSWGPQQKTFLSKPTGKGKVRFLRSGSLTPGNQRTKSFNSRASFLLSLVASINRSTSRLVRCFRSLSPASVPRFTFLHHFVESLACGMPGNPRQSGRGLFKYLQKGSFVESVLAGQVCSFLWV